MAYTATETLTRSSVVLRSFVMTAIEGKKAVELRGILKLAKDTIPRMTFLREGEKRLVATC